MRSSAREPATATTPGRRSSAKSRVLQQTGEYNAFFGQVAGGSNTTGSFNAFFGRGSEAIANTTGQYNTSIGFGTARGDSTFRTVEQEQHHRRLQHCVGGYAGHGNTTGSGNVFIGDRGTATASTTEQAKAFVGAASEAAGITNATAIGYRAQVTQSNSLVLGSFPANARRCLRTLASAPTADARLDVAGDVKVGNYLRGANNVVMGSGTPSPPGPATSSSTTRRASASTSAPSPRSSTSAPAPAAPPPTRASSTLSMDGKVGIGTTSPAYKLHVAGDIYTTGTYQGSDLRLKDQVQDLGYGLGEVLRLRPVSYRWKDTTLGQPTLGLIAQEVRAGAARSSWRAGRTRQGCSA